MFWTLEGDSLKKRTGIFGNRSKPKYVTALSFMEDGSTVSGDSSGNIIVWQKGKDAQRTMGLLVCVYTCFIEHIIL